MRGYLKGKFKTLLIYLFLIALVALLLPVVGMEKAQAAPSDILLASSDYLGNQGNAGCTDLALSADGKYVVFSSNSTNLVPGGTTHTQIFRKNLQSGEIKLCSADASAVQGNNNSVTPAISSDGRFVVFQSAATNLVPGGTTSQHIFRKDLETAEVKLCSATSAGVQGNSGSALASISSDGRYVAFLSSATNLVAGVTHNHIYRKDLQTGAVYLCSADVSGNEGNDSSTYNSISSDGRYVAFDSQATNLVPGGTPAGQVFRKDLNTGAILLCSSSAGGAVGNNPSSWPGISYDGRFVCFYSAATNLTGAATTGVQVFRKDVLTGEVKECSANASSTEANGWSGWPSISYDGRYVLFTSQATNLVAPGTTLQLNAFRKDLQTGEVVLCSSNATGGEGNNPTASNQSMSAISFDGRYVAFISAATNLVGGGTANQQTFRKELSAPYTFYFAEGYTGPNFHEYICLGNPNAGAINATITYMFADGTQQNQPVLIPSGSRATVDVNTAVGGGRDVSAKIVCDSPFVAERPMYFNYQGRWTGGHDAVGSNMTSTNWYFAEGYTASGFDEWICVLNPGDFPASLTFRFQTQEAGEKVVTGLPVLPHSRASFPANTLLGGHAFQTSLKLESNVAVVAERPMYFDYSGTNNWGWQGGSCVVGKPYLASQYYLAEGTTRSGFEEWLTLQNPNPTAITINATYQLGPGQGAPVNKTYTIDANKRGTVYVPGEVGADKDASVYLTSTSPFLAERPMYFDYQGTAARGWEGGHCVIGAAQAGRDWYFAEGYTASNFDEWLCIQNPGPTPATVQISYFTKDSGALPIRTETIPSNTRQTFLVNTHAGPNHEVSARIQVTAGPDIVVERPMYFNYNGWDGGSDVLGYTP